MPVPIPGPEVGSDSLKVKFLMIFGRPKIGFFGTFAGPRVIPVDGWMDTAEELSRLYAVFSYR